MVGFVTSNRSNICSNRVVRIQRTAINFGIPLKTSLDYSSKKKLGLPILRTRPAVCNYKLKYQLRPSVGSDAFRRCLGPIKCQVSVPTRHPLKSVFSFSSLAGLWCFGLQSALLIYIKSGQKAGQLRVNCRGNLIS